MLAILDVIDNARNLIRDCSDDEADWPALAETKAALNKAFGP